MYGHAVSGQSPLIYNVIPDNCNNSIVSQPGFETTTVYTGPTLRMAFDLIVGTNALGLYIYEHIVNPDAPRSAFSVKLTILSVLAIVSALSSDSLLVGGYILGFNRVVNRASVLGVALLYAWDLTLGDQELLRDETLSLPMTRWLTPLVLVWSWCTMSHLLNPAWERRQYLLEAPDPAASVTPILLLAVLLAPGYLIAYGLVLLKFRGTVDVLVFALAELMAALLCVLLAPFSVQTKKPEHTE